LAPPALWHEKYRTATIAREYLAVHDCVRIALALGTPIPPGWHLRVEVVVASGLCEVDDEGDLKVWGIRFVTW
jgi:hypothetical protein